MKRVHLMNRLVLLLFLLFPLGQLTRLELGGGVTVYLHDFVVGALFGSVLLKIIRAKRLPPARLTAPLFVFTGMLLASLILGISRVSPSQARIGALYLFRWIGYSGIYFSLAWLKPLARQVRLFGRRYCLSEILLFAGASFAALGLIQYFVFPDARALKLLGWDDHYFRLIGTLLDPDYTGIILVLTLVLAVCSIQLAPLVRFFLVGLTAVTLLLTYSRASYLALAAALLVIFLQRRQLFLWFVAVALFLAGLLLLPRPAGEGVNLLRVFSITGRLQSWQTALETFSSHPLLGVGYNLLRPVGSPAPALAPNHAASGIQNSYLFVLATAGVVGLLAFLWLLKGIFSQAVRHPALLASLAAISVHALFSNTFFYPWVMIWLWTLIAAYS